MIFTWRKKIMSYIKISNIKKYYRKKQVLKDITLEAEKGTCIGIVGANGCGKSTLLKILAGAIKPSSGSFSFESNNVGYIPQDNPLFDNLTVYDNLRLWYCDSPTPLEEEIQSGVIARFGIDKFLKSTVQTLSGGMKKRLSIACGVANKPDILILDEPGASLDIICKEEIKNYIAEFVADGGTVIIASHEERELSVCTHKYLMNDGKLTLLAKDATMDEIFRKLAAHE